MRTTLTLDDDIYARVRAVAGASGKRIGVVVSELIRQRLEASAKRDPKLLDDFDFVTLPKCGVTIRSEAVENALNDEGIEPAGR